MTSDGYRPCSNWIPSSPLSLLPSEFICGMGTGWFLYHHHHLYTSFRIVPDKHMLSWCKKTRTQIFVTYCDQTGLKDSKIKTNKIKLLMENMWVDSIFLWVGVMVWLGLVLSPALMRRFLSFCSTDNQDKPFKVTGYFIFHQAIFKIFICLVLCFVFFLHCGTYKQL